MNKRKWIFLISSIVLVLACVLYICSRNVSEGRYLSVLPHNVIALSRIHVDRIAKEYKKAPDILAELFLYDYSNKTGIDFGQPLYAFADFDKRIGIVGAISEQSALTEFLEGKNIQVFQENNLNWAYLSNFLLVYDREKILAFLNLSLTDSIKGYMTQLMMQEGQTYCAFHHKLDSLDCPMSFVGNANILPESVTAVLEQTFPKNVSVEDFVVSAGLSVHGNDLRIDGTIESDKPELLKLLDKIDSTFHPVGEYKPIDISNNKVSSAVFMNADGQSLLKLARSIPNIRMGLLALNMCIDADLIISAMDGPLTFLTASDSLGTRHTYFIASLCDTKFLENTDSWDDNLTSGAVNLEKYAPNKFSIGAWDKTFCFEITDRTLCVSNTFCHGGATRFINDNAITQTLSSESRMVIQMRLNHLMQQNLPESWNNILHGGILSVTFSDSRHFSIQPQ